MVAVRSGALLGLRVGKPFMIILLFKTNLLSILPQLRTFGYQVKKSWNVGLINSLFSTQAANAIIQTPIIDSTGQDILVWTLTPAGEFSSKSAYKHCFNNLQLPRRQRPKIVPQQTIMLLNQVWRDKQMAPRVQTFAWRLLRKAIPTGKRASKLSKHIQENCSRCGAPKDEMHMLFLCPFSKAAWFCSPWYIKIEFLAAHHRSIHDMIEALLNSGHPHITLTTLYTFLWCLWKARNDALFCRKLCRPSQVYAASNAIIQATKLEVVASIEENKPAPPEAHMPQSILQNPRFSGNTVFCDAAWEIQQNLSTKPAGIGVVIQAQSSNHFQQLHVSAMSPPASSPLQAETYGLLLATMLTDVLHIQDPYFYTDCSVLASAALATNIFSAPGHWENRPLLAQIQASPSFHQNNIGHINRNENIKAHHLARLALKIKSRPVAFRCLCSGSEACTSRDVLSQISVFPFTLLSVKCT